MTHRRPALLAILGFCAAQPCGSAASDADALSHRHFSHTLYISQVENGRPGDYIALEFNAGLDTSGSPWARCTYAVMMVFADKKQSVMTLHPLSSDAGEIQNVQVSSATVSFDIDLGWKEQGGSSRKLHFVATRIGGVTSSRYRASASAVWREMPDPGKLLNIEWRQRESVVLPYPLKEF